MAAIEETVPNFTPEQAEQREANFERVEKLRGAVASLSMAEFAHGLDPDEAEIEESARWLKQIIPNLSAETLNSLGITSEEAPNLDEAALRRFAEARIKAERQENLRRAKIGYDAKVFPEGATSESAMANAHRIQLEVDEKGQLLVTDLGPEQAD